MRGPHASRTEVRKEGGRRQRRGNLGRDEGQEMSRQPGPRGDQGGLSEAGRGAFPVMLLELRPKGAKSWGMWVSRDEGVLQVPSRHKLGEVV